MKIFKQETDKSCGVACLRSIFNYYGNNFSEKDILKRNKFLEYGQGKVDNPLINLGLTGLKFGYKVEYIGYNPLLFFKKNFEKEIKERQKKFFGYGKFVVSSALNFLKLGGKISFDKLNVNRLKELIDKNKFILVEVKPAFLRWPVNINSVHKFILDGYNKKGFHALNTNNGKASTIDFDSFMIAFYGAVPEILIIKNKN